MTRSKRPKNLVELDGRTGEGGGQLVRIAVGLSALTGTPIRIHHVRGNRPGKRGGGLKAQHAACITYLAHATSAETTGCHVGSVDLTFIPRSPPSHPPSRTIHIDVGSAGSTLLIFQSLLPFLIFACSDVPSEDEEDRRKKTTDKAVRGGGGGGDNNSGGGGNGGTTSSSGRNRPSTSAASSSSPPSPSEITLSIRGGTHVPFSLTFDYLDQVLLPALESSLGLPHVERHLERGVRGWAQGPPAAQLGTAVFRFEPLPRGRTLWPPLPSTPTAIVPIPPPSAVAGERGTEEGTKAAATTCRPAERVVERVDVSIAVPAAALRGVREKVLGALTAAFPGAETRVLVADESGHETRYYVLLVATAVDDELSTSVRAHSGGGSAGRSGVRERRVAADLLYGGKTKGVPQEAIAEDVARKVVADLRAQVRRGGDVDEYLQDQLVVFQALARGRSMVRGVAKGDSDEVCGDEGKGYKRKEGGGVAVGSRAREDRMDEPFGEGSMHTKTARWVVVQMLPGVRFENEGRICEGVGWRVGDAVKEIERAMGEMAL